MLFGNIIDKIINKRESALSVFVKAQNELTNLKGYISKALDKTAVEVANLESKINTKDALIQTLQEEYQQAHSFLQKVEAFLL